MTNSQIATLRNINERPGLSVYTIGLDYARDLVAAGFVTIRRGKCYPTPAAARRCPSPSSAFSARDASRARTFP
jgi:hypothetical protein